MSHWEASLVADYLNQRFSGPRGVYCTFSAFSDYRTNEVDSDGFWKYGVHSPNGAYRFDGSRLTFNEELDAIRSAETEVLDA